MINVRSLAFHATMLFVVGGAGAAAVLMVGLLVGWLIAHPVAVPFVACWVLAVFVAVGMSAAWGDV